MKPSWDVIVLLAACLVLLGMIVWALWGVLDWGGVIGG